jgi:hypothetical protein
MCAVSYVHYTLRGPNIQWTLTILVGYHRILAQVCGN